MFKNLFKKKPKIQVVKLNRVEEMAINILRWNRRQAEDYHLHLRTDGEGSHEEIMRQQVECDAAMAKLKEYHSILKGKYGVDTFHYKSAIKGNFHEDRERMEKIIEEWETSRWTMSLFKGWQIKIQA